MPLRCFSASIIFISLLSIAQAAEIPPESRAPLGVEIYTFAELLSKAERIVVAEVGPMKDGTLSLIVRESIKAPEMDSKYIDPERLKRAAELLDKPQAAPLAIPSAKGPAIINIRLQNIAPPREGVQAVFLLWEKPDAGAQPLATYKLAHPQCMYDIELLPQIKAGAAHPRTVADGRFLREWDKQMAERRKQREVNAALLQMKGGETVMGLRMSARRPVLSLRGNNSFSVTAVLENTRTRDQAVYDGPAGGYGMIIRPKVRKEGVADGGALVLRQTTKNMVSDVAVLNITDLTDFATVPHESSISKELFFDSQDFRILTTLQGEYTVSVFFSSTQDGRGLEIGSPVWTGAMISEEVPLKFDSPMSQK